MAKYGVHILIFCLVLMPLLKACDAKVTQNPSGQLENNFAVDLYSQLTASAGFISVTPINFSASAYTIEIQSFSRVGGQCLLSMGTLGANTYFSLQEDNGYLVVRVGSPNLPNFNLAISSVSVSFGIWNSISVVIRNINSTTALVSAFINGTQVIDNSPTLSFPSGLRGNVTLGLCQERSDLLPPQGPQIFNGIFDNFRVWNTARTIAEIESVFWSVDVNDNLTSVTNDNNLIAFYPFTEGRGITSRGLALGSFGTADLDSSTWLVKYFGSANRLCSSTDSQVAIFVPSAEPIIYNPPQLLGQWQQSSCGPNFVVRVYRAPVQPWSAGVDNCDIVSCGPTIINAFTVKAFDDVFFVDTAGQLTVQPLNGKPVSQSYGTGIRQSGVRYSYQVDQFVLEIPLAGIMTVGFADLARGGVQSNIDIQHTTHCEAISGVTGLCSNVDQQVSWDQLLFVNESFCNDQYLSGGEQCDSTMSCTLNCTCAEGTNPLGGLCLDECGNGIITGLEQCERTYGCVGCQCKSGTRPENGKCIDVCGDEYITGAEQCDGGTFCQRCQCLDGYRPTSPLSSACELIPVDFVPRVVPTLDCLDVLENGLIARLHFSYDNSDGFAQTIEYGEFNKFTPDTVATTRPTIFSAGKSLTHPLSPYMTNISSTVGGFTWILGSFNLAVDLANLAQYQCPKAPAIEIRLTTSTNFTSDNVQTIINNLAGLYGIDPSRVNVTVVFDSTTQPPTYVLIVVINGPTNSTEKDAIQVVIDLFEDLKEDEDETKNNLSEGLDDVEIKEITTRPTGVEVRGQPTKLNENPFRPADVSGGNSLPAFLGTGVVLLVVAMA